jgi:hypothetical protein
MPDPIPIPFDPANKIQISPRTIWRRSHESETHCLEIWYLSNLCPGKEEHDEYSQGIAVGTKTQGIPG